MLKFSWNKLVPALLVVFVLSFPTLASADHERGNQWTKSGKDMVTYLHLDGRIVTLRSDSTGGFLRQGYGADRDDKRNVEADRGLITAPRGKGFDWVFLPAGRGYWYIANLKTGIFLTADSETEKATLAQTLTGASISYISDGAPPKNVYNWGLYSPPSDRQKWKLLPAGSKHGSGQFSRQFAISNKATGLLLTPAGGNVMAIGMGPDDKTIPKRYFWRFRGSDPTELEKEIRRANGDRDVSRPSFDVSNLLKLTITSVKAIKTSTGQDAGTKVLFAGIDLAVDIGMGIGSGGATAAAKAAAKTALKGLGKKAARQVTRKAVIASAEAALRKQGRKIIEKGIRKGITKSTNRALGDPRGDVKRQAKEAMGFAGAAQAAANVSNDALDALSSEAIFNKVYGESPDDLDIGVNGSSIYPNGGRSKGRKIKSQQTRTVNKFTVFEADRGVDIHLIEYDYGSDDDSLGWVHWRMPTDPGWLENFVLSNGVLDYEGVLISEESEGSLYELNYRIEPLRPYALTQGKLRKPALEAVYASRGCTSTIPEDCAEYVKELMGFNQWVSRPRIRDRVLETYEKHCTNSNGLPKSECRAAQDPMRAACDAGHSQSCTRLAAINKAGNRFLNLRIWEGNCGLGQEEDCVKLGAAIVEGAPYKSQQWEFATSRLAGFCGAGSEDSCRMTEAVGDRLCARQNGNGCYYLGWLDEAGKSGPVDVASATRWYTSGCDMKSGLACSGLAEQSFSDGKKAVELDKFPAYEEAISHAARACSFKYEQGCTLKSQIEAEVEAEKQKNYYNCLKNQYDTSCTAAGVEYEAAAVDDKGLNRAFDFYRNACKTNPNSGDGAGCYGAGKLSLKGGNLWFAKKPQEDAFFWFNIGCDKEHVLSCVGAGEILASDTFPGKDVERAYTMLEKACGDRRESGNGIEEACAARDRVYELTAFHLDGKGCAAGIAKACIGMAKAELNGAVSKDPAVALGRANSFYRKACDLKSVDGCMQGFSVHLAHGIRGLDIADMAKNGWRTGDNQWLVESRAFAKSACELKDVRGCRSWHLVLASPVFGADPEGEVQAAVVAACRIESNSYAECPQILARAGATPVAPGAPTSNNGTSKTANRGGGSNQNSSGQSPSVRQSTRGSSASGRSQGQQSAVLDPNSCSARGTAVSNANGVETKITFDNKSAEDLFVFWVGFDGQESNYNQENAPLIQVAPGASQTFDAMTGFQFSVFDRQGNCLGIANLTGQNQTFEAAASAPNLATGNGANNGSTQTTVSNAQNSGQSTPGNNNQNSTPSTDDDAKLLAFTGDGVTHGCEIRGQIVSQNGGQPTKTAFANFGADNLFLFWIDFNGQETDYAGVAQPLVMLAPGQVQRIDAQTGFAFSVFDQNSNCVGATTVSVIDEEFGIAGQGGPVETSIRMVVAAEQQNGVVNDNNQLADQSQNQIADQNPTQNDDQFNDQNHNQQTAQTAGSCDLRGTVVSTSSGEIATTTIFNSGSGELSIFWIDFNGQETDYSGAATPLTTVAPGTSQNIDANIGFAYSIFDQTNTCLGVAQISQAATEFTFAGNHFASDDNNVVPHDQTFDDTSNNDGFQGEDNNDGQDGFDDETQSDQFGESGGNIVGGCELRGQTVSTSSGEAASAVLSNNSAVEVDVFWIDFNGQETDYDGIAQAMGSLEPGETETIDASVGFKFIGLDLDGNCIGIADIDQAQVQVAFQ